MSESQPTMSVLGFPLHVRPGFLLFMVLIVAINEQPFGLWLAGSVAGFTLVHELGHAVAARRAGATAEISLDFLAGYASYVPSRPLTHIERAGIAFAGPAVHIALSVTVLFIMGVSPSDIDAIRDDAATLAVFWAGPMIGALNLLPVLPLDGGNIVQAGLDKLLPERSERIALYGSIALTAATMVWLISAPDRRVFVVFVGVILIMQMQMLYSPGGTPRPDPVWERATEQLQQGKIDRARLTLERAVRQPGTPMPMPPSTLGRSQLVELVHLFGPELPTGNPNNEYVLSNVLLKVGDYERAAHYAANTFTRYENELVATIVARAANASGDPQTAIAWLQTAARTATTPQALLLVLDRAPELGSLRHHPDIMTLRHQLES